MKNLPITLEKHTERLMLVFLAERSEGTSTYDLWADYVGTLNSGTLFVDVNLMKVKLG